MVELSYHPVRHEISSLARSVTVLTINNADSPVSDSFDMPLGIIDRVLIEFPRNCNRHIHIQIFQGSVQWLPGGSGSSFCLMGHEQPVGIDCYKQVFDDDKNFIIRAWNDGDVHCNHVINVWFTVKFSEVI